jgi:hypothetical protein
MRNKAARDTFRPERGCGDRRALRKCIDIFGAAK